MIRRTERLQAGKEKPNSGQVRSRHKLRRNYSALFQHLCIVRDLRKGQAGQSVGITGCRQQQGVSTIAANLALESATTGGQSTLLVGASAKKPNAIQLIEPSLKYDPPFLADALSPHADVEIDDCISETRVANLHVLRIDGTDDHSAVFTSSELPAIFERLVQQFAWVIVDLPPADQLSNGYVMAAQLDGVLLVIADGSVQQRAAVKAKERLIDANANVLGVVFNRSKG